MNLTSQTQERGSANLWGFFFFNFILATIFTVLLTAPAISFFDDHIFGYPHDGFGYVWRLWWYRESIDLGVLPGNIQNYVNYPFERFDPYTQAVPLINIIALPFIKWLGALKTYNLILISGFVLSWLSGAFLSFEVTKDRNASSVGGALFAFHANNVAHAVGGHLAQTFVFLIPIVVIALMRLWHKPTWRRSIITGLLLGASMLIDLKITGLLVIPLLSMLVLYFFWSTRKGLQRTQWLHLGIAFLVTGILVLPFYGPLLIGRVDGGLGLLGGEGVVRHSADLLGFITPSPEHPLYRNYPALNELAVTLALPGWHENIFYLGIVALALAMIGVVTNWEKPELRFWLFVFLSGLTLALGPVLKIGEEVVTWNLDTASGTIPLPYVLLQQLPFYDWSRTPGRFITLAMVSLAILVSYGVAWILSKLRRRVLLLPVMMLILSLMMIDQLYIWPWPLSPADPPGLYEQIANDSNIYAILDLPLEEYRCGRYQLYYATLHEKPIVGGVVTRVWPEALETMKAIEDLALPGTNADISGLTDYGIGYVIVHEACSEAGEQQVQIDYLITQLGNPVYSDEWITAFKVPDS